jgi:Hydrazine synthase alpha subunit middle domain
MLLSSLRMSFYSATALCLLSCGFVGISDNPLTSASSSSWNTSKFEANSDVKNPDSTDQGKFELAEATILSQSGGTSLALTQIVSNTSKSVGLNQVSFKGQPNLNNGEVTNPVMFVTQVPVNKTYGSRMATFLNHLASPEGVPRGGDLHIRYPDGSVRNLTKEASFGNEGLQGSRSIAVRDPSVHWSGTKALFSMVVGAPAVKFQVGAFYWQIYEVSGLGKSDTVSIKPVPNQPKDYNNISPFYGTDDRVLFTSDRPRNGDRALYPQLDEYESSPTITGIWSLNPSSGDLRILNHAISGAFSPSIDSFGRVIFTRWDHLQRDQQVDLDNALTVKRFKAFNFTDESASAQRIGLVPELFPEARSIMNTVYGPVNGYNNNMFTPWQINEDGTDEVTLNHVGRQELTFGFITKSFMNDPALKDSSSNVFTANKRALRGDGGVFHIKEDPTSPGLFYAIYAEEFGSMTSDQIISFNGAPSVNAENFAITDVTLPNFRLPTGLTGGRFRNPLPLSTGGLIASHTPTVLPSIADMKEFRLRKVISSGKQYAEAGEFLTQGITKSVTWFDPDNQLSYSGQLWELEPVEIVARQRPVTRVAPILESPESAVFKSEKVNEETFKAWLKTNDLAMIVTRNQTSRDRADLNQPYNLAIPGGVKTVVPNTGPTYNISHFQIFQADQVRGYEFIPGRRPIATPLHDQKVSNLPNPSGPVGSVKIAPDGSTAALVPARRALTWQSTDSDGVAIVRERSWITLQPGEVRVCASCHSANKKDQAGNPPPENQPEALRLLLKYWKTLTP